MGAQEPRAPRPRPMTQKETQDAMQTVREALRPRVYSDGHDGLCEAGDPEYMTTACRCAERQEQS
jgi:hypothetical protein